MLRIESYKDWRGVTLYRVVLAYMTIQEGYTSHANAIKRVKLCIASIYA